MSEQKISIPFPVGNLCAADRLKVNDKEVNYDVSDLCVGCQQIIMDALVTGMGKMGEIIGGESV